MSNTPRLSPPGLDADLSRLTERLESEISRLDMATPAAQPASEVAITAPPGAIFTIGLAVCAGAIWLVSALPY